MATLLLRLAAPLQSWGMDSKFETRKTGREPTKSGVVGLLAAACGIGRKEPSRLEPLNALRFGVRVDQEGALLVDYHTARKEERGRGNAVKVTSYQTKRHYLADAIFLVGLESRDAACLHGLAEALRRPAFPLFLGRRSCPPTLPVRRVAPGGRLRADGAGRRRRGTGRGAAAGSAPLLQPDAPAV